MGSYCFGDRSGRALSAEKGLFYTQVLLQTHQAVFLFLRRDQFVIMSVFSHLGRQNGAFVLVKKKIMLLYNAVRITSVIDSCGCFVV